ncbi:MAG: polysaccharide deacetylase family protein [Thermodesulfobacteriota bacterium]|nr:polysaccharide deacetylase family protein [Thermodesulfobacteriota bacterium]
MRNAFCIDLEDYYQVNNVGISYFDWDDYDSRIQKGTSILLCLLERFDVKATFFIVSYIAQLEPNLICEIAAKGHEIACHTHTHQMLNRYTPDVLRKELEHSVDTLQKLTGSPILGFRAPSWSLTMQTLWVIDILKEIGFKYDSSILPFNRVMHLQGIPHSKRTIHRLENGLIEFPVSVGKIMGLLYPFSLGTVFRLTPYAITRRCIRRFHSANQSPVVISTHPWELDPYQPRHRVSALQQFILLGQMSKLEHKLTRLFQDFSFGRAVDVLTEQGFLD